MLETKMHSSVTVISILRTLRTMTVTPYNLKFCCQEYNEYLTNSRETIMGEYFFLSFLGSDAYLRVQEPKLFSIAKSFCIRRCLLIKLNFFLICRSDKLRLIDTGCLQIRRDEPN